jgi:hypothetical protein
MGNYVTLDHGLIMARLMVFDPQNKIFLNQLNKRKPLKFWKTFDSFYSKEYGGTFHFILIDKCEIKDFMQGWEFEEILVGYLDEVLAGEDFK